MYLPALRRHIPNVVVKHSGTMLHLVEDYIRCEYTDEAGTPPVDFVTSAHRCVDQAAWCARPLHNVDVRLTAWDLGLAQMWDEGVGGWVYVHAEPAAMQTTADTFCRALGFTAASEHVAAEGTRSAKNVSCSGAAAKAGKISVTLRLASAGGPRAPV
jgi:hypothetical protein